MATKKQLEPVAPAADKKKALAAALGQIEKQFGKGSVMRLGENTGMNIEHIPPGPGCGTGYRRCSQGQNH